MEVGWTPMLLTKSDNFSLVTSTQRIYLMLVNYVLTPFV
jgi:hypothetical protein